MIGRLIRLTGVGRHVITGLANTWSRRAAFADTVPAMDSKCAVTLCKLRFSPSFVGSRRCLFVLRCACGCRAAHMMGHRLAATGVAAIDSLRLLDK